MTCPHCGAPVESTLRTCCHPGREEDKARQFARLYGVPTERVLRYLRENPEVKFTGASFTLKMSLVEWLRSLKS